MLVGSQMQLPLVLAYYGALAGVAKERSFFVQTFPRGGHLGQRLLRWSFTRQDCFDHFFGLGVNIFLPLGDVGRVQRVNRGNLMSKDKDDSIPTR